MVNVAPIVISLISLVGALLSAILAGWFTIYSDERKRLSESEKLVSKYRDPLLLAARDLQSRLYHILQSNLLGRFDEAPKEWRDDIVLCYTSFLVGQYFSWTHILRKQAQFLCFSTDKDNKELAIILDKIQSVFNEGDYRTPFTLWRGTQMAIGEIMTEKADGELFCLGYSDFHQKWIEGDGFRRWFDPIETGIAEIESAGSQTPIIKLRQLQHLLLDLICVLDPKQIRTGGSDYRPCRNKPSECNCSRCSARLFEDIGV